ncbi:ATP-binding cassette domain-containing protein [Oceanobacillus neutriphilus]|uniref:Multidrug ABC transporter ATP-binding protein n=1 Tax=Oceanobacillus neutriphilus TaxID=531815 RepID=A0ABQ2P171_9BACI|nr:ATP-binding cassette domain-containing protein [Oceanobacillus neutriphilus]GGP15576.1 multidrug ABC transporter ATP-binding protein [Oceanobacillus neutriphilus]
MIQLNNIVVQFGDKKVLNGITTTFQPGEIIGLVAPNGTGKSTLLNVLMNYVTPAKGEVTFKESYQYISKKKEAYIRSLITMMPDQSDLYNHLNGVDHLNIYRQMWHRSSIDPDQVIQRLNMSHYIKDKTYQYSLGMRQRLCFAMQIVANTPYMLMDEVMNGLDPDNVELISKLLEEKKKEGKIIIIASHLLENLEKYADRILFLKGGEFIYTRDYREKTSDDTVFLKFSSRENGKVIEEIKAFIPDLDYKELANERVIMDVRQFSEDQNLQLQEHLKDNIQIKMEIGPLDLLDRYSLYYSS